MILPDHTSDAETLRPSQFNIIVEDYPQRGKHLIYNSLSQALIELDDAGLNLLKEPSAAQEQNEFLQTLREKGLLVPSAWHEGERYLESLETMRQRPGGPIQITLLTTLEPCFLNCVYCFQKGTQTGGKLTTFQSDRILDFIEKQCLKHQASRLWVSYYGSEPLSNIRLIFYTARALREFSRKERIPFRFGMVTNGVLLTRSLVQELTPLGFIHAQITIDGNRHTHNASRPFRNGRGSYDQIVENLLQYAGLIRTDVLCTVDMTRAHSAYELVDTLASEGLAERKVRVKFSPLSPDCFGEAGVRIDSSAIEERLRTIDEIAQLTIYAAEHGLVENILPERVWCGMQRHDGRHLVIEPDGTLRTCAALIGRGDDTQAGHIDTGLGGIDGWIRERYQRSQQCLACKYLPICADCRLEAYATHGSFLADNPQEDLYDRIVSKLIKGQHQLLLKQKGAKETRSA